MRTRFAILTLAALTFSGCEIAQILDTSGTDGRGGNLGPNGTATSGGPGLAQAFVFTEVNPPGLETWLVDQAHRTEEGIWVVYVDPDSDAQTIAFLDFVTRQWTDWGGVGDIQDIAGDGLYLTDVNDETRLQWVQGVEVDISVLDGALLGDIAIEHGIGTHQAQKTLFWNNQFAWREEGLCCPNQWARVDNDDDPDYAFTDEVWGGYPGTGGAWASSAGSLWWVGFEGWDRVEGVTGGYPLMAIDRVGHRAYATAGCTLHRISPDLRQSTLLEGDMGAGIDSGLSSALCQGFGYVPIDVDDEFIYAPFGKIYETDGGLVSGWLGIPELDPDNIEQYQRDIVAFGQAYSPAHIFVDPTAFGDVYVWSGPVQTVFGETQPGGWLHIQAPIFTEWRDPHPNAQF